MAKHKLANGYGSITKMKDKFRRNPFRVRVTVGWEISTGKAVQKMKTVGYFSSYEKACEALAEYNKCPYDLTNKEMTFEDVYKVWSKEYFEGLKNPSGERTVKSAYAYSSGLYKLRMRDIRTYHLKDCMDKGFIIPTIGRDKGKKRFASPCTKERMKSLYNLMFDYAYEHDIVDKNYARAFKIDESIKNEQKKTKKEKIPFNNMEIELLWNSLNEIQFVDMVLISIYSGWRPQELAILQVQDIDIENGYMKGGMKTEAGIDRFVPIHPLIKDLVVKRYEEAQKLSSTYLFNDPNGQQGTVMTYDKYRTRFKKVMERLGLKHTPHETRHTFISLCKDYKVDEYAIKKIVGHATSDVTEFVYTHRNLAFLTSELRKVEKYRKTEEDYGIDW